MVEGLRDELKEPPTNLGWWVSFWNPLDPRHNAQGRLVGLPVDDRLPSDLEAQHQGAQRKRII